MNQENSYLVFSLINLQSIVELKIPSLLFENVQESYLYTDAVMI